MSKGKLIKQINNLKIYQTKTDLYSVWTLDGRCLEDNLLQFQAIRFCSNTKDFLSNKN